MEVEGFSVLHLYLKIMNQIAGKLLKKTLNTYISAAFSFPKIFGQGRCSDCKQKNHDKSNCGTPIIRLECPFVPPQILEEWQN